MREQLLLNLDLIIVQLAKIKEKVDDKTLIHVILEALPLSWKSSKSTFGTIMEENSKISFTHLESQLQAKEAPNHSIDERVLALS